MNPHAREGIRLFNRGAFFEAHEALEQAWREESSPVRDLYRGLLQVAVVYYHLEQENYAGAIKVYRRCVKWLQPWSPECQGVQVGRSLADLEEALLEVRGLGPENLHAFKATHFRPIHLNEPNTTTGQGILCDQCGGEMRAENCKLVCSNCGYRFDCSDLTLYFD